MASKETVKVGIDLGTTNTLVRYMGKNGPVKVKFGDSGDMLPSFLYLDSDGKVIVGDEARSRFIYDPNNGVRSSKTYIGKIENGKEKTWVLRQKTKVERKFTPVDVATELLREVKRAVIEKIGKDVDVDAIITVPAYFKGAPKEATKKAGINAGLNVLGIMTEPEAAAVSAIEEEELENGKVFVVDLGGGTFDVTAMSVKTNATGNVVYETIDIDGNDKLGGDNFDELLEKYILNYIEEQFGVDLSSRETSGLGYTDYYKLRGRCWDEAIKVKKELSRREVAKVTLMDIYEDYSLNLHITRETFENMCEPLFKEIRTTILRLLSDCNLKPSDLDFVILAGGSCNIPKISADVKEIFGKTPTMKGDISRLVVDGACKVVEFWNDPAAGQKIVHKLSHSMGISMIDPKTGKMLFDRIIAKGEKYPVEHTERYRTTQDNQASVDIEIYEAGNNKENVKELQAVGADGSLVYNHDLYGSFEFKDVTIGPKGQTLDVTFTYDESGILTVKVKDVSSGKSKVVVLEKKVLKEKERQNVPTDFIVLLDTSGSMGPSMSTVQKATNLLIDKLLDGNLKNVHRIGVIKFDDKVKEIMVLTNDASVLKNKVRGITASGLTAMADGIKAAYEALNNSGNKRRVVIMLTDGLPVVYGEPQEKSKLDAQIAANDLKAKGVDFVAIGMGAFNFQYLKTMASKNMMFTEADVEKLPELFSKIADMYLTK